MQLRISQAVMVAVCTLALSIGQARAADLTISTAQDFSALDGSASDDDAAANGCLTVNGNLTIDTGGEINANDPVAPSGDSATAICINVTGNMVMTGGGAIYAENRVGEGSGGAITIDVDGNFTMEDATISSSKLTGASIGSAGAITIDVGGDVSLDIGANILGTNSSTTGEGATIDIDAVGSITLHGNSTEGADIIADQITGSCNGGSGGDVNLDAGVDVITEDGSRITVDARCSAGAILIVAARNVDIGGLVQSDSQLSGTGATQAPGGGPITIIAGVDLTVTDTGVIRSQGRDPGADLVHLEGCTVLVYGLVESTGIGHGTPNNPPNHLNSTNRPDKPSNSTAGVEIWAGTLLLIDSTGTHNGQVNADIGGPGGSSGTSWIDLIADGDVQIIGDTTGPFAVHANGVTATTDNGGDVTVISVDGTITASGLALQASAPGIGGSGGNINVFATDDVTLDTATLEATGETRGGHFGEEGAGIKSFQGTVSWQDGVGDVRATGTAVPVEANRGTIVFQDCTAGAVDTTGTSFPITGGSSTTPTSEIDVCGGTPVLESYVDLPQCATICGDGNIDPGEECESPFNECCDPATCLFRQGTLCRIGSGDGCDPNEACTGSSDNCPADTVASQGTLCRTGTGVCDPAEVCTGVAGEPCPGDTILPSSTLCRDSSGICDPPENCTGSTGECPGNVFLPSNTLCRASSGVCDPLENCTGSTGECPGDVLLPSNTICRSSSGVCDPQENCTGSTGGCPGNVFLPSNTICRSSSGVCDPQENCTGSTGTCPGNAFLPDNTICRASAGACDVAEECTGSTGTCPGNAFQPTGTPCRNAAGVCDVPDVCSGTSAACVASAFLPSTTLCRTSTGVCDPSENCSGTSGTCPTNVFLPSSTTCRSSSGVCDQGEQCTGSTGQCPANTASPAGTPCTSDDNACTADLCNGAGTCGHSDISDECNDNSSCTVDTCEPSIGCVYDDQCGAICRSPGYWATHSGFEQKKGKATINVAQLLLDLVGPLEVCGETISATSNPSSPYLDGLGLTSDLEGLCMRAEGVAQRRLYRQLVAAALNCAASGFANDCDEVVGQFVNVPGVDDPFSDCSDVCAGNPPPGAPSINQCVGWMDCFNNGGHVGDEGCAFGTCETQTTIECGGDAGDCPNDEPCVPFVANCHEAALCNEDIDFCPKSTPASSTAACREARFNECTIDSCP